jgi:hypothetical protein
MDSHRRAILATAIRFLSAGFANRARTGDPAAIAIANAILEPMITLDCIKLFI